MNEICLFRKKIEQLINEYFPINKLTIIPGDVFWCNYLFDMSGIYILFFENKIIYIGISSVLQSRLPVHFNDIWYGEKITSVGIIRLNYIDASYRSEGWAIEAYLINKFKPIYNRQNQHLIYHSIPVDFNINEIISQIESYIGIQNKTI